MWAWFEFLQACGVAFRVWRRRAFIRRMARHAAKRQWAIVTRGLLTGDTSAYELYKRGSS